MSRITFEIGELVRTLKGLGVINVIKPGDNGIQYSIQLEHDKGIYWFSESQVFKYI